MKDKTTRKYIKEKIGKNIENVYHVCWATGGRMVSF